MAENKTILFILPFMPYPLESGGHQALYNGIKAVKDDYNVLVTYPAVDNKEYHRNEEAFVKSLPGIVVLPMLSQEAQLGFSQRAYQKTKNVVKRLLGIKPVPYVPKIYDWWIHSLSPLNGGWWNHLETIFNIHSVDIVQVEMPPMIGAVYYIPQGVKKLYVHHELAFVRHELEIQQKDNSQIAKAHAEFTKMIEINLLNKYDAIITLSQTDKQKLEYSGVTVPVYTSFAVVDTTEFKSPERIDKILSFVGPDHHNPNYEGILWFLNNCWTSLKSIDNSYRLRIIGKWSEKSISFISSNYKDVDFMGYVDDLGEVIKDTVMIVPITIGSGIRMKILEAASRGVPVVSTSVGAEGLPLTDGVQCFIKDTPDVFVQSILSLQDSQLAKSMCNAAYETVKDVYSFSALQKDRLSVLKVISCDA